MEETLGAIWLMDGCSLEELVDYFVFGGEISDGMLPWEESEFLAHCKHGCLLLFFLCHFFQKLELVGECAGEVGLGTERCLLEEEGAPLG
jgi:hypothetical protein